MSLVNWLRIAIAGFLLAWGMVAYQDCKNRGLSKDLAKTAADLQEAMMDKAEWETAAVGAKVELQETVPELERQLAAAKEANATLLAAAQSTGRVKIRVRPLAQTDAPASAPPPGGLDEGEREAGPLPVSAPPQPEIEIEAKFQEAVAGLADGRISWTRRLFLRQAVPDAPWSEVPLHGEAVVAPELVAAWQAYIAPQTVKRRWRTGWTVGVGVAYGIGGRATAGAFVGWGIQF